MAKNIKVATKAVRAAATLAATQQIAPRKAKANSIAIERIEAEPTPADIRGAWGAEYRARANHIIRIMQTDGISYARAVKRSRRRLINEGRWD